MPTVVFRRPPFAGVGLLALIVSASTALSSNEPSSDKPLDPQAVEFFEKRIRPLLSERCWVCHGAEQSESELRLDSRAAMLEGGSRGPAIVPNEPDKSLLIRAVNHADTLTMPPKEKLAQRDITDLTEWVRRGAPWPKSPKVSDKPKKTASKPEASAMEFTAEQKNFWAFQPITDPVPPSVRDVSWIQSPLDRFVLAELEKHGLQPARQAHKRTLIRRATFDLLGIPPMPEEVATFLADESSDAFARVVDRLLASPRYGERWGRHWLDVARYGDSNGLDENLAHATAFRYRDWVIAALNRDLPYDQFVREQVAGDLLPFAGDPNDPVIVAQNADRLTATGFLVIGAKMLAEDDPLKMQMDIVDEQVDSLGKAFLGLTLGCARCHDHKFDPIPMADYYSLAGIFKSTKTMLNFQVVAQWQERPLASPVQLQRLVETQQQVATKQNEINQLVQQGQQQLLAEARARVGDYVLAATQQIVLDRATLMFGVARDADPKAAVPEGVQIIEAENYQRGSAIKLSTGYGEGIGVILSNGNGDWFAEYDVTTPSAGLYQLESRYAAAGSRPTQLSINGTVIRIDGLKEVTGTWNPDSQRWHIEGHFELKAGVNLIRLDRREPLPHIDKLLIARLDFQPLASEGRQPSGAAGGTTVSDRPDAPRGLHPPLAPFVAQWKQFLEKTADDPNTLFSDWRELLTRLKQVEFARSAAARSEAHARATRLAKELVEAQIATNPSDVRPEALRKLLIDTAAGAPFAVPKDFEQLLGEETRTALTQRRGELKPLQDAVPKLPETMAVSEGTVEDLRTHLRGHHTTLGKEVHPRRFPRILAGDQQTPIGPDRSGRLEFARWLTEPTHPLTARVMVNRLWLWHFGSALVRSPDNFGLLGERPTHPALLDWLSRRFIDSAWSIKQMHRRIMLSAVYQMDTAHNEAAFLVDPDNRLWSRRNRRRLEVEAVRDSLLAVSGRLDNVIGGSLLPTPNRGYVTGTANFYPQIYDSNRRSVYLPVVRSALYELYQVFDFAEPSVLNGQRESTTIATQALFMLNSKLVADQSRELASRLLSQSDLDDPARVRRAYLEAFQREPSSSEIARSLDFVQRFEAASASTTPSEERRLAAWRSLCRTLLAANEFLYVE